MLLLGFWLMLSQVIFYQAFLIDSAVISTRGDPFRRGWKGQIVDVCGKGTSRALMLELKSKGGYGCPKMDRVCQMGLVICFSEMIPSPFIVSAASRHRVSWSRGVWDSPARWSCQALLVAALRDFCRCSHPSAKATWVLRVMFWRWGWRCL